VKAERQMEDSSWIRFVGVPLIPVDRFSAIPVDTRLLLKVENRIGLRRGMSPDGSRPMEICRLMKILMRKPHTGKFEMVPKFVGGSRTSLRTQQSRLICRRPSAVFEAFGISNLGGAPIESTETPFPLRRQRP
jgi:hypothetical protein